MINTIRFLKLLTYIATDDPKDSKMVNKLSNDDIVLLKSSEINLNNEMMKFKSEIKLLSEISNPFIH